MAYYIGMDGGATKTLCAVGSENALLATAAAGPSTLLRASEESVRQSLIDSIANACTLARVPGADIVAACLGSTGAAREDVAHKLTEMLVPLLPNAQIHVCGDMEIALASAYCAGPGVVVVSGTGSIAFGRNADGRTARAGGLGPETSDEGSGYWIGKRGRALVKHPERAPAALFPLLLAEAKQGNAQARELLADAGVELAKLAASVCQDLFGPSQSDSEVHVAMVGGVFRHSLEVRQSFREELTRRYADAIIRPRVVEPVKGALWMARRLGPANSAL